MSGCVCVSERQRDRRTSTPECAVVVSCYQYSYHSTPFDLRLIKSFGRFFRNILGSERVPSPVAMLMILHVLLNKPHREQLRPPSISHGFHTKAHMHCYSRLQCPERKDHFKAHQHNTSTHHFEQLNVLRISLRNKSRPHDR